METSEENMNASDAILTMPSNVDDFLVVSDMSGNVPNFTVVLCNEVDTLNQDTLHTEPSMSDIIVDQQLLVLHNKMSEMFTDNVTEQNNTLMYYVGNSCDVVHEAEMAVESSAVDLSEVVDTCNSDVEILEHTEPQEDIDLNELDLEKFVTFIVEESDHETSDVPPVSDNPEPESNILQEETAENSENFINIEVPEKPLDKKREKNVIPSGVTLKQVQDQYGPDVSSQYIFMKRYFCSLCSHDFCNKKTFSTHVYQSHDKKIRKNIKIILKLVRVFDCNICNKCFCGRDKLKRHVNLHHALEDQSSNAHKERKYSNSSRDKCSAAEGIASKRQKYTDAKHNIEERSPRKSKNCTVDVSRSVHKKRKLSHSLNCASENFVSSKYENHMSPKSQTKIDKNNEKNSKVKNISDSKFVKVTRNILEFPQKSKKWITNSNSVKMPRITRVESLANTKAIVSSSQVQKEINCIYCFKSFRNETSLNIHVKYCKVSMLCTNNFSKGAKIIEQERYFCPACQVHYKYKTNVKQHLKKKHSKNKYHELNERIYLKKISMVMCNLCTNVFRYAQELLTHVKSRHPDDYDLQKQMLQQLLQEEKEKQGNGQFQETDKEDKQDMAGEKKTPRKINKTSTATSSVNLVPISNSLGLKSRSTASSSCDESTEVTSPWKSWSGRTAVWKCNLCSKNFKDKYALREHKDSSHNKAQVKPVDLPQETESGENSNLWDYLQMKPPAEPEILPIEDVPAVPTVTSNFIVVQTKRYFCPKCTMHFSNSVNAYRHMRTVHQSFRRELKVTSKETDMFQCLHCLKLCLSEENHTKLCVKRDVVSGNSTIPGQIFKCAYCYSLFLSSQSLDKHLIDVHYNLSEINKTGIQVMKKRYYCSQCPKHFACHKDCRGHILSVHDANFDMQICCKNTKLWFCKLCSKKKSIKYFKSTTEYVNHINNNHGFSCILDNNSSAPDIPSMQNINLKIDHLPLKKVVTAYICPECNKPFMHSNSVYLHFRNKHIGSVSASSMIQKIMQMGRCKKCPQYFFFKANLQKHELICNANNSSGITIPQQIAPIPKQNTPILQQMLSIPQQIASIPNQMSPEYNEDTSIELEHSIFPSSKFATEIKEEPTDDQYETQPKVQEFESIELISDIKIEYEEMEEPVSNFDFVAPDESLDTVGPVESCSDNPLEDISIEYQPPTQVIKTRYCCTYCPRHLSTCTAVRDHIKSVHNQKAKMQNIAKKEIPLLLCKACPVLSNVKYFVSEEMYNIHFNYKHLKIGASGNTKKKDDSVKTNKIKYNLKMKVVCVYICPDCNSPYLSLAKMKQHMNTYHENSTHHLNEIPKQLVGVFKCNKCQKYFFKKSDLYQHGLQIHCKVSLGLKLKSEQENNELVTIDKLMMKVSVERFYCPHCSKHFSCYKSCLIHTNNVHSLDMPSTKEKTSTKITDLWVCNVCCHVRNKTYFASKAVCESHCKLKHKICLDEETFKEKPQVSHVSQQQQKSCSNLGSMNNNTVCETQLAEPQVVLQEDSVTSLDSTYDTNNHSNEMSDEDCEAQSLNLQDTVSNDPISKVTKDNTDKIKLQEALAANKPNFSIVKVNVNRYFCPVCDLHFHSQSECTSHQTSTHPKVAKYIECKMTLMYKCNKCSTYSDTSLDLEEHNCKKLTTTEANKQTEVKTRTNGEILSDQVCMTRYFCPNCDKNFSSPRSCSDHMFSHSSAKHMKMTVSDTYVWKCSFCPNFSNSKYSCTKRLYIQHLQQKHDLHVELSLEQTVECDKCAKSFTNESVLKEHKDNVHNQASSSTAHNIPQKKAVVILERIPIELNENETVSASEIIKKIEGRNINEKVNTTRDDEDLTQKKRYLCPQCECVYETFNSTVEHIKDKHPEIEISADIKMKISNVATSQVDTSLKHENCSDVCMNLDDDDKKSHPVTKYVKALLCQECKKPCITSKSLKMHYKFNHKNVVYDNSLIEKKNMCIVKCNFCHRCFFFKSSLLNHERTHTDLKLSCSHCDKTFTSEDCLKTHELWSHAVKDIMLKMLGSNDAKLLCDICNEMCDSKLLLEKHMKKKHCGPQKSREIKTAIKENKRKIETSLCDISSKIETNDSNLSEVTPIKKKKMEDKIDLVESDVVIETNEIHANEASPNDINVNNASDTSPVNECEEKTSPVKYDLSMEIKDPDLNKASPNDINVINASDTSPVNECEEKSSPVKYDLSMEIKDPDLNKDTCELSPVDEDMLEAQMAPGKDDTSIKIIDSHLNQIICETSIDKEKEVVEEPAVKKTHSNYIKLFSSTDADNFNSNCTRPIEVTIKPLSEHKVLKCFGNKIDKICTSVTAEVDPTIVINVSNTLNKEIIDTQVSGPSCNEISLQDPIIINISPELNSDAIHPLNSSTGDSQIQNNININSNESVSKIDTIHFNVNPLKKSLISQITQNKPLICQYCNTQFSTLNRFLMHVRMHLKLANQSSIEIVLPDSNLQQLLKPTKSVPIFICQQCDMEFKTDKLRIKHLNDIHKLFSCTICKEFVSSSLKKQHYKFHKQVNKSLVDIPLYHCEFCQDIQFKSKFSVKRHITKNHLPNKLLTQQICCICDKKVASRNSLKNHLLKVHSHLFE